MQLAHEMLVGTPLLLRTVDERNQERLQICTCQIDPKGQLLKLCEQDGTGQIQEVRINTIAEVIEELATSEDEDEPGMLKLTFKGRKAPIELICASHEDFTLWRDGLRTLVGASRSPASPGKSPAQAAAAAKRARTIGVTSGPGTLAPDVAEAASLSADGISQLLVRLKLQEELIAELRQENGVLNEMVKQKDVVIKQFTRDLQSRGSKAEQCNKTESTSRESDDHLRDRESAILKRQNLRLEKKVKKQQSTIANLMKTLQSALKGEASDADMLRTEDEADEVDSDTVPGSALAARGAAPPAHSDGSDSDPQAMREEVQALTGKLASLERSMPRGAASGPSQAEMAAAMLAASQASSNGSRFQPPPRGARQQPTSPAAQQQVLSPQAQRRAALAAAQAAGPPQFDFSAVGGAPSAGGMSKSSRAALEALSKEMAMLEEKKRQVEHLARQLEPPSDNESDEDDGFPLQ